MNSEDQFLQKLMISKKIMEKHNEIGRNGQQTDSGNASYPTVAEYQPVNASYNLPKEFLPEQEVRSISKTQEMPTEDRIMNSKLPDEIKKLMMEHPIQQPTSMGGSSALSNDLIEKASRLMNTKANGDLMENAQVRKQPQQINQPTSVNVNDIKSIVRETVEDVLRENGLLVESTSKSNELFKFRVGQHLFEGKLTSIKKVSK